MERNENDCVPFIVIEETTDLDIFKAFTYILSYSLCIPATSPSLLDSNSFPFHFVRKQN